jgi:hypothetical protein
MNRDYRRRTRQRVRVRLGDRVPNDLARAVACPDCDSDVEIDEYAPGLFRGVVRHDDSCPWYAQLRRDLA